jgi:predicted nucleotidyltransferase component of viral defense system
MLYHKSLHLAVERFHAEFLRALAGVVAPGLYAVKGGVNLRLCLGSIRCSEDLDLDIQKMATATLQKNVDKILGDRLPKVLMPLGFSISQFSSSKQTETVQRWKITLLLEGTAQATKIEFSRRGMDPGVVTGFVHASVALAHQMPPFAVPHYALPSAVQQKVAALAGRPLTQARDIFDLHYLFSQENTQILETLGKRTLDQASENCLSISYADYLGQVVAYLPTEYQPIYRAESIWKNIQETVFHALQTASTRTGP